MEGRPAWTDCDEAGDYVVPNVLRDLVSRPHNMDETVPHKNTLSHSSTDCRRINIYSIDLIVCELRGIVT